MAWRWDIQRGCAGARAGLVSYPDRACALGEPAKWRMRGGFVVCVGILKRTGSDDELNRSRYLIRLSFRGTGRAEGGGEGRRKEEGRETIAIGRDRQASSPV